MIKHNWVWYSKMESAVQHFSTISIIFHFTLIIINCQSIFMLTCFVFSFMSSVCLLQYVFLSLIILELKLLSRKYIIWESKPETGWHPVHERTGHKSHKAQRMALSYHLILSTHLNIIIVITITMYHLH